MVFDRKGIFIGWLIMTDLPHKRQTTLQTRQRDPHRIHGLGFLRLLGRKGLLREHQQVLYASPAAGVNTANYN